MNSQPDICNESRLIIDVVENSLEEVCSDYRSNPSHFFTENDLVCRFYYAFHKRMGNNLVRDAQGNGHSIFHTEYPTPFRCDMHGSNFIVKGEEDRTPRGKKYKRGHYDVVIINPNIIEQLSLEDIRLQEYGLLKRNVLSKVNPGNPMILYGLEFLYERGDMTSNGADNFIDKILQDHKKLLESTHLNGGDDFIGFLFKHKTITFFENGEYKDRIEGAFKGNSDIWLVVSSRSKLA